MRSTKLYQTLVQLTVYERNSFNKYLKSPYFNKNEKLIQLFEHLDQLIRGSEEVEISKEELWGKISDVPFQDVKFRKASSDLLKLLEDFLALENYKSHPFFQSKHLLEALSNKKLEHLYKSSLSKAERLSEQRLERSSDYHHFNYEVSKHEYNLTTEFAKKQAKSFNIPKQNIEALLRNLDHFYITEKLRYYCTILSWKKLTNYDAELLLMEEILETVESKNLVEIPSIGVYYDILMTMQDPEDESHYYSLKEKVKSLVDLFPDHEVRDIYDSLVSYCIQRVNKGHYQFQREVFEIYKEILRSEVLFVDGNITPTTYRNIVFFALRVQEYDWAEDFANQYVGRLKEVYQINALNFSLARIYFYRKQYEDVISYLQQVDYEDIWYNLNSRTLLIAAYYELDEYDALESLLGSFKVYISRNNSIPESRQRNYLNLIKYIGQLYKLLPSEKQKLAKLKTSIENNPMVNKPWILQKLGEKTGARQ